MRFHQTSPMSDERIQKVAPSVFSGQAHSSMSDRYAFISTADVLGALRQSGYEVFDARQSNVRLADRTLFAKHSLTLRQAGTNLAAVGDAVPGVTLTNSHSGSAAFSLAFSMLVLKCLNGLIVADATIRALHIRHTGDLLNRVVYGTQDLLHQGPRVHETIKLWKTITLSAPEQNVFAEEAHALRFTEGSPLATAITPAALLKVHRTESDGNSLWDTFQNIQENALYGGNRGYAHFQTDSGTSIRRVRTREVKSIDKSNRLNKSLWSLAEKMAELKGAAIA
jgi:hypothetical protein